jgi:hypothetical protein
MERRSFIFKVGMMIGGVCLGNSTSTFAQGSAAPDRISIEYPKPLYVSLTTTLSGLPVVMVANGALRNFAHPDSFPYQLEITIRAKDIVEQGMPSKTEQVILNRVGDEIDTLLLHDYSALFLARYTWNGVRRLLYRVHDAQATNQRLQDAVKRNKPAREWEYKMAADIDWATSQPILDLLKDVKP